MYKIQLSVVINELSIDDNRQSSQCQNDRQLTVNNLTDCNLTCYLKKELFTYPLRPEVNDAQFRVKHMFNFSIIQHFSPVVSPSILLYEMFEHKSSHITGWTINDVLEDIKILKTSLTAVILHIVVCITFKG